MVASADIGWNCALSSQVYVQANGLRYNTWNISSMCSHFVKKTARKKKKMRCIFSLTNSFCVACAMTCVIRNSLASVIYIHLCLYWNKREKLKPHETTTPTDQINIRFEFELVWLLTNSVNGSYRVNCSTLKLSHILIISVIIKNKATIH